jgi:hypothetical protein
MKSKENIRDTGPVRLYPQKEYRDLDNDHLNESNASKRPIHKDPKGSYSDYDPRTLTRPPSIRIRAGREGHRITDITVITP